jgi:hypothetical protein
VNQELSNQVGALSVEPVGEHQGHGTIQGLQARLDARHVANVAASSSRGRKKTVKKPASRSTGARNATAALPLLEPKQHTPSPRSSDMILAMRDLSKSVTSL